MEINSSNIEAYFLLYIDNELTEKEVHAVDLFITLHPVYLNELNHLRSLKLKPPTTIFENKFDLYQISEQEEQILLYLDNELPKEELDKFKQSILSNPSLSTNLADWENTKLNSEDVLLLDVLFKKSLYKKESFKIRPLYTKYYKLAWASVAALFIGMVGYFNYYNSSIDTFIKTSVTTTSKDKESSLKGMVVNTTKEEDLHLKKKEDEIYVAPLKNKVPFVAGLNQSVHKYKNGLLQENKINAKTTLASMVSISSENIRSSTSLEKVLAASAIEEAPLSYSQNEIKIATSQMTNDPIKEVVTLPVEKTEVSAFQPYPKTEKTKIYKELDIEEGDRTLYIGNIEIDGSSIRGLSRKISSLFKINNQEKNK